MGKKLPKNLARVMDYYDEEELDFYFRDQESTQPQPNKTKKKKVDNKKEKPFERKTNKYSWLEENE